MTTDECCFGCDAAISTDDEYEVITYENGTEEYWHSLCLKAVYEDDDE